MAKHKWKNSWPGNCCLKCWAPDPFEDDDGLVPCPDCANALTNGCKKCCYTGWAPNPSKSYDEECPVGP